MLTLCFLNYKIFPRYYIPLFKKSWHPFYLMHINRGICEIQRIIKMQGFVHKRKIKTSEGVFCMSQKSKVDEEKLEAIFKAIQDLQFGEVQITIQDGAIVQINRLEKKRFTQKDK